MNIDMYCVGFCRDNGKPTQIASCGIVIIATDGVATKSREFGYALGNSTANMAEIQSIRLALASVAPAHRGSRVAVHTTSKYALKMLEQQADGTFASTPSKNVDIINEMRKWLGYYRDIELVMEIADVPELLRAKELARSAVEHQENYDSLSQDTASY